MARQIRLDQIDDVMREAVEDLVASTTLEWTKRVKKATPVDTLKQTQISMEDRYKTITGNGHKQFALCRTCLFWNKSTTIMGWFLQNKTKNSYDFPNL